MPDTPPPFTPVTLGDRWRCSPGFVRSLCRQGRLRHFTIGRGQYRIPATAVEAFERGDAWGSGGETSPGSSSTGGDGTPSGQRPARPAAARSAPLIVAPR